VVGRKNGLTKAPIKTAQLSTPGSDNSVLVTQFMLKSASPQLPRTFSSLDGDSGMDESDDEAHDDEDEM
jgi:hypothetical protein